MMSDLLAAALWYAKRGYYVFPLIPGAKEPAIQHGVHVATTDLSQIRRWWTQNPRYNIGLHCGPSGLLVLDADTYKPDYCPLPFALPKTVEVRSAHGSPHKWYRMPEGKRYGNATGTLPKGNDVRGFGGYVVAPPSVLVEDGKQLPYAFVSGHKPTDIAVAPLPAALVAILDAAYSARKSIPITFTDGSVAEPDLSHWPLSDVILDLIQQGAAKGGRSEADQSVITALARLGATDDEIRAVFVHFPIGGKYEERGDKYLAHSIGNAKAYLQDHPPEPSCPLPLLLAARQWVRSPACLDQLRAAGNRRLPDLVKALDALVETAIKRRSTRLVTSQGEMADRYGVSTATAHRHLQRIEAAGLLIKKSDAYGTLLDLSPILEAARHNEVDLSEMVSGTVESISLRSTSSDERHSCLSGMNDDFFADHRIDDAFTSYPYSYAIKRREMPSVLMQSLGASGLLLWNALQDGGTVADLAEVTGLTVASIRATLKRFNQDGLLVIWQEGRAKVYELHPNAEERLEERREHMTTAGIGQLRAARNANERASFAQRKLQGRMPLDSRERAKLEMRRDKADDKAAAHIGVLTAMGVNPYATVRPPRPPRSYMKIDHGEEWVSIHRPIYEQWQQLQDLAPAERYRLMGMAGYTRREIDDAKRMAGKVGRGPRQFVGLQQEQEAVAA